MHEVELLADIAQGYQMNAVESGQVVGQVLRRERLLRAEVGAYIIRAALAVGDFEVRQLGRLYRRSEPLEAIGNGLQGIRNGFRSRRKKGNRRTATSGCHGRVHARATRNQLITAVESIQRCAADYEYPNVSH